METELGRVIDALPGLVWTSRPDGYADFLNKRWLEYTGLSEEQAMGLGWQAALHPDDLPELLEFWHARLLSREPGEAEARLRRFDGSYRWFQFRISPVTDASGRIVRWCGINTDVEDLKNAEEAARLHERRFRSIIDGLPAVVTVMTPEGEFAYGNQRMIDYLGASFEELKARPTTQSFHPEDRAEVDRRWEHSVETGEPYDYEARLKGGDGVYRWFHSRGFPLRDPNGTIALWYLLQEDIDDRKRADDALRASEQNARAIVDGIPGLVAVFSPDGILEQVNQQVVAFWGKSQEDLKDWASAGVLHPEDVSRTLEEFKTAVTAKTPFELEVRARRADGVYCWLQSRGFPLKDADGRIVRWYNLLIDIDERKRAEEALSASERNLRQTINAIPTLVFCNRADGPNEFLNQRWHDYTGLSHEEARGGGWQKALHPGDLPRLMDHWMGLLASGESGEIEGRLRRFDGVYRWFLFRSDALRDDAGKVIKWFGTCTDIEDRKMAEEAVASSERNLRQTFNAIPTLAWCNNTDGSNEYLNKRWHDYTGLSPEEAHGWGWQVTLHPEDLPKLLVKWQAMLASGEPGEIEARLRRHDGVYRWFLFRCDPLRDESGAIVKWYGTNTDIEDLKRAEQELRRSEEFLTQGEAVSETGSFLWRVESGDITLSSQLYRIFEFEPGTRINLAMIAGRFHPEDRPLMDDMVARARAGRDFEYDHRLLMPDGLVKHIHLVAHATRDSEGRLELIGAARDVSDRRISEEALSKVRSELAHVSRVSSLGALTASIAHEVNQPLSGIITNASTCLRMLGADPPNVEGARETARRTIRDGNRASEVITRLRAMFKKEGSAIESVDLNEAAREVIALSLDELQRNRVVMRQELAEDLPAAAGNRVQLQQVILNLVLNAADAMSGINDRPRALLIRTELDEDDQLRLTVRDSGTGIDAQSAGKLFDAFYTTKVGGMGIGLSVSRSIIENHHGRLWAKSNDGHGATFSFSIPRGSEELADLALLQAPADATEMMRHP